MNDPENSTPPRFWAAFFRWFCNPEYREDLEGDLEELLERRTHEVGLKKARWLYRRDVIRLFRPGIFLRKKYAIQLFSIAMIGNYIKIALRNFGRQKAFALLNVAGLATGIAASLLILQYVRYERSFDRFHSRAEDIYRIQYNGYQNGQLNFESAVAVPAAAAALRNNFPEVEEFTRFLPARGVVSYEKPGEPPVSFAEERMHFADTNMFKVFDFKLVEGDRATCLKGVNKVIISASTAAKYFAEASPVGMRLNVNGNWLSLEVTGIFADVPENSHIKFDLLISYETLNARTNNQSELSWGWYDFYSFVLLRPGTDVAALQAKWDKWLANERAEDWQKNNTRQEFILRPLISIHLYSNLLYETSPGELRDGDSVYALSIIAFLILMIAWVNYINLATARALKRSNEVGVRKVVGAFRGQLIQQFLTESFLLNLVSTVLAVVMVRLAWQPFSALTGWSIPLTYFAESNFWIFVGGLLLAGSVLSGAYPAIVLSSFKPVSVLKGKLVHSVTGNYLRKGLVIFQYVASVILISGSLIVFQQLEFMKNKDLGIDLGKTLVLKGPQVVDSTYNEVYTTFKNELLTIPGVKGISASTSIPGEENYWTTSLQRLSAGGPEGSMIVTTAAMDHEHVPQYGIRVVAGRNFDRQVTRDSEHLLINESLSRDLGFARPEEAVGERVRIGRDTVEIIGVLGDFHQMSLKAKVIPLACRLFLGSRFYSVKLEADNYHRVLESVGTKWEQFFPGNPFDYFFLDQFFNRQYERDERFGRVFTIFTALAIFTAALGLLALSSFMAVLRTREIGIRKVLGSTASQIIMLLSKGLMLPVILSFAIAIPLGWWIMEQWLETFPYRTSIDLWVFGVSCLIVLIVAFVSVASQALKAALTKPAETLKYE